MGLAAAPAVGQRHPESAGPLPYYRDDNSTLGEPEWLNRPPFVRGPLDRYERGYGRTFLATPDAVPYLNYADDRYIAYLRETIAWTQQAGRPFSARNVRWDRMGTYMGPSYQRVFSWEEARSGSDSSGVSYIDHKGVTLRVGHYSYKTMNWTVTAGTDVRTRFTPLTLDKSHMEVARIDLARADKDRATLLFNRGQSGLFSEWGLVPGDTYEKTAALMYGMRYEHDFGSYARIGTTLLNQFLASPSSPNSDFLRGDLPYEMLSPKTIRVFVADDSPDEAYATARVYGVDVVVVGERDGQTVRLTSMRGDEDYDSRLEPVVSGGVRLADGGLEAVGHEPVIYAFTMPTELSIKSARFSADVADDYRIGVRQVHEFPAVTRSGATELQEQVWPADFTASDAAKRQPFKWYVGDDEEPYYTVRRSDNRGADGANRSVVSFDYGMPTGQSLAGFDWEADLVGLQLSGEMVSNLQRFMFPVGDNEGDRSTAHAVAYWMNGLKELPWGMEVGLELFRLEPDYLGGYDSSRGGMSFHLDNQPRAGQRVDSTTQEFGLVEDNDDNDQWPDAWVQEIIVGGEGYPGWANAGTYPGLDENSDNIADIDRNENFVADWDEAFLMFDSDPPDFVYGIDFNNNGVPDFRENDDLPDFPYRRDQKGRHEFLRLSSLGPFGQTLSLGHYDNREIAGGGRAKGIYLRYKYRGEWAGVGAVGVNYDVKRVQDDIADHTYIFTVPPDDVDRIQWVNTPDGPPDQPGRFRPATPDPLAMRDSWVHTAFVETETRRFWDVDLTNALKWMRNSQAEIEHGDGSLLQPEDVHSRLTLVNKVDYTWTRGNLSVRPRFKHRLLYESLDSEDEARTSTSEFMPIVTANYNLTANTRFVAGVQGLPLLPYKNWDRIDEDRTFSQWDKLAMMRITSEYQGIGTSFFLGYKYTRREYSRAEERNTKNGTLFMDIIAAF